MGQATQVPGLPVRALAMLLPGVPEQGRKVARQCPLFSHSLAQQAIYMHCVKVPDSPPAQARGRGSDSFYSSFPPAIPLILGPRSPLLRRASLVFSLRARREHWQQRALWAA